VSVLTQAGISVERYPSGGGQSLPDVASLRGAPRHHSLSPSGSPGVLAPVSEHQARKLPIAQPNSRPSQVSSPDHVRDPELTSTAESHTLGFTLTRPLASIVSPLCATNFAVWQGDAAIAQTWRRRATCIRLPRSAVRLEVALTTFQCAKGSFLGAQRSASANLGLAGSGGLPTAPSPFSSQLSGSPGRELLSGFAARVARAGSPGGRASPRRSAYGSVGSLSMSRAASAGLPPLGSPGPTSVRLPLFSSTWPARAFAAGLLLWTCCVSVKPAMHPRCHVSDAPRKTSLACLIKR